MALRMCSSASSQLMAESRHRDAGEPMSIGLRHTWHVIVFALMGFCVFFCAPDSFAQVLHVGTGPALSGSRVISGTVVSALSGQPLDTADMTLTDSKSGTQIAETATDAEGRFEFDHVADGKYSLQASHRGYLAAAFDEHDGFSSAIVTGDGLVTTGLRFTIQPLAVIYGTVAEDSGDPVQQARVSLYRVDENSGAGKIVHASTTISDDLGDYEFAHLAQGTYYIAVTAHPWYASSLRPGTPGSESGQSSPLDVAYPTTFYADVTDSDSATPIPVKAGDHIPVNFSLHPVPAVHMVIQLPGGIREQFRMMPQIRQEVFGEMQASMMQGMRISTNSSDGSSTTELSGIAPGHYEVDLRSPNSEGSRSFSLDATSGRQALDAAAGEPGVEVAGKVTMTGSGELPPRLMISLANSQGGQESNTRVERNGTFKLQGISPGTYEVHASAGNATIAVRQISATGATVDGHTLKISGAAVSLTATLVEGSATVNGFAKNNGKAASGAMVVLVPADPGANRELFRRDQSNLDGSFTMAGVVPGNYTLVAIADGWKLNWAQPEVIGHYLAQGVAVMVSAQSRDIQVKDAVPVQAK